MYEKITQRIIFVLAIIAIILVIWMMAIIAFKETRAITTPEISNEYFDKYEDYYVIKKSGLYEYSYGELNYINGSK